VLRELATDDVTLANERLSANDMLALALALEVTPLMDICVLQVGAEMKPL